jgi:hypothetical protein
MSRERPYLSKLVLKSARPKLRLSKIDIANSRCEYHQDSSIGLLTTVKDIRVPRKIQRHSLEGIDLSELILKKLLRDPGTIISEEREKRRTTNIEFARMTTFSAAFSFPQLQQTLYRDGVYRRRCAGEALSSQ